MFVKLAGPPRWKMSKYANVIRVGTYLIIKLHIKYICFTFIEDVYE